MTDNDPIPTGTVRDTRMSERTQGVGHGNSRASVDTAALRIEALGAILDQHDPDALRQWRLGQMAQLGIRTGKQSLPVEPSGNSGQLGESEKTASY